MARKKDMYVRSICMMSVTKGIQSHKGIDNLNTYSILGMSEEFCKDYLIK